MLVLAISKLIHESGGCTWKGMGKQQESVSSSIEKCLGCLVANSKICLNSKPLNTNLIPSSFIGLDGGLRFI